MQRVDRADELLFCELFADGPERRAVVAAGDKALPAPGRDLHHQCVAQKPGQLRQQDRRVLPVHPKAVEIADRLLRLPAQNALHQRGRAAVARKAHGVVHRVEVDHLARRALVEETQRVAHAAIGQARDELRRVVLQREALFARDVFQIPRDGGGVDALEAVALAAGQDRRRDLLELRGCKNEHQVLRRLLEDFQQGVEGRGGEHVYLVHDVDALFDRRGAEHGLLPQGAHVVHAVVGGGIQLHHVEYGPLADPAAGRADAAGVTVDGVFAVDSLRQDAGAGGLAGPSGADEDVRVGEAARLHLVFQGLRDVLLPDNLVKGLRPPLAVQRLIHPRVPPGQ